MTVKGAPDASAKQGSQASNAFLDGLQTFCPLWASAEVGVLRAAKASVQLLPSKTRAITMKINKQMVLF